MDRVNPQQIEAILASLPNTPENDAVAMQLQSLLAASQVLKSQFTYSAKFYTSGGSSNIAAGATSSPQTIAIDASAPFLIVSQTYDANTANAARNRGNAVIPNATVEVTESGSGKKWSDEPVMIPSWFGTGEFPFILPEPKLLMANSALSLVVTNTDAAAGYNIRLYFHGYKLFKLG